MPNLVNNHTGIPFQEIQIQDALNNIKIDIETAISLMGERGKNALIRTQRPIKLIHDAVKTQLIAAGVHVSLINPDPKRLQKLANSGEKIDDAPVKLKDSELPLAGYLKKKNQDISVVPNNIHVLPEKLKLPTYLNGFTDYFGAAFTEAVLSINVRSQLSSVAKNFDTLYERTFAEALNFHLRLPNMVLGEVYMIIAKEYDSVAATEKTVAFKNSEHIEKYILAFQALNGRINTKNDNHKYERVALLIVDFNREVPKLYSTTKELMADGLIPSESVATIEPLAFNTFVNDLITIYQTRFPDNSFS